ncbi:putative RDD family membrane protein YckC [Devosia subaequoris]|uniref:Putative RDD family membrane protein YckC n=1 Tax=Devosia subaequoris TaxID=395930 RepID=A0A7W6IJQ2_9HYPH|nr:RDD family protein [Devosia subaequoris]MBB4050824.1 putative RDD family membrane protein YckC [Devosia subaequoris]MCP1208498.1 RDD family protein [Devosia subaequoris]
MTQDATARPYLPDPSTAPELFDGLLTRRATAYVIDVILMSFLVLVLVISLVGAILGFFTFGLAWVSLVFAVPAAIILYYAATLGSPRRATVGMQMMDIVLTPTRGQPLDGWMAILHALVFWITIWISWPVTLLFALFTPRRQMIHDFIMGTLMVRRSPMMRHWQRQRMYEQDAYHGGE